MQNQQKTRESVGMSNDNCSLESLLIEPAQRIPRYRLLLKGIIREVEHEDGFRPVMAAAMEVASSIAALDEDEETRRAAALFGLGRAIDGLPVSHSPNRLLKRWYYLTASHRSPASQTIIAIL